MKKKKRRKYEEGGGTGGSMQVRTRLNTMPRVDQLPEPPSNFFNTFDLLNPFTSPLAPHNIIGGMMGGGMMMEKGGKAKRRPSDNYSQTYNIDLSSGSDYAHGGVAGNMLSGMMLPGLGYNARQNHIDYSQYREDIKTAEEIERVNLREALQKADRERIGGIPTYGKTDNRRQHIEEGPRSESGNLFQQNEDTFNMARQHVIPTDIRGNMRNRGYDQSYGMLGGMMGMPMPFANGGEVPDEYLTGASSDSDITVPGPSPVDINIESKEFVETPEGEGFKVPGNVSHENTSLRAEGGINMTLPENSFIYPKGKWTRRKEGRERQAQKLYKELEGGNKSEGLLRDDYKKNSILQKLKNLQLEDESDRYEITEIKKAKEEEGADSKGFQDGGEAEDNELPLRATKEQLERIYEEAYSKIDNQLGYSKTEVDSGEAASEFAAVLNEIFQRDKITGVALTDQNDPTRIEIKDSSNIYASRGGKENLLHSFKLPVNSAGKIPGELYWGKDLSILEKAKKDFASIKSKDSYNPGLINLMAPIRADAQFGDDWHRRLREAQYKARGWALDETFEDPNLTQRAWDRANKEGRSMAPEGASGSDLRKAEYAARAWAPDETINPIEKEPSEAETQRLTEWAESFKPSVLDKKAKELQDQLRNSTDGQGNRRNTPSLTGPVNSGGGTGGTDGTTVEEEDFYKVKGFGKDVDDLVSKIGAEGKEEGEEFDSGNYLQQARRIGSDYINNQSQLLQMMFPGGPEKDYPNYWQGIQNKSLRDLDKMVDIVDQENKIAKKDANIDFATMKDMIADYNPQKQSAKFASLFNAKRNQDRKQFLATLNKKAEVLGKKADYNFKGEKLTRTGADKALELEDEYKAAYGQAYGALNNFMYQNQASNLKTAKDLELEAMKFNSLNDAFGFQTDNQGNLTMKNNKPMETVKNGGLIRRKYKRGSVVKKMYDNRSSNPSPNMASDRDPYVWGAVAQAAIPLIGSLLGGMGGDKKEEDDGGESGILGNIPIIGNLLEGLFQHGGHTQRYEAGGPSAPNLEGVGGGAFKPSGMGGGGNGIFGKGNSLGVLGYTPGGMAFNGLNSLTGGNAFGNTPNSGMFGQAGNAFGNALSMHPGLGMRPGGFQGQMPGGGNPLGLLGATPAGMAVNGLGKLAGGILGMRNGGRANGRPMYKENGDVTADSIMPPLNTPPTTGGGSGIPDWVRDIFLGPGYGGDRPYGGTPPFMPSPDPDAIPRPKSPGADGTAEEWENYYKLLAMWQKMSKKPEQQGPGGLLGDILGGGDKKGGGIGNLLNMMPHRQMMGMMGQQGMGMGMNPGMNDRMHGGQGTALRDRQKTNYLNSRNPYFA